MKRVTLMLCLAALWPNIQFTGCANVFRFEHGTVFYLRWEVSLSTTGFTSRRRLRRVDDVTIGAPKLGSIDFESTLAFGNPFIRLTDLGNGLPNEGVIFDVRGLVVRRSIRSYG